MDVAKNHRTQAMNKLTLTKTEAGEVKHVIQQVQIAVQKRLRGETKYTRIAFNIGSDAVRGALVAAGASYDGFRQVSFPIC